MKKYLSIFTLLLAGFLTIAATAIMDDGDIVKKYMVIHHKDAKSDTIFIENIDSIDFGEITIHIPQIDSVKFSADNLTIEEGQTAALTYSVYETDADQNCTIAIADKSIADYKDGVVSAIAEGSTTIIATASDNIHADTCYVTVTKKPVIAVTGITISLSELSLDVDNCFTLSATVSPSDATDKSITWTSTDEKVATVSNAGLVTAIAEGNASIIAASSDGLITDTCSVTVTIPAPTDTLQNIKFSSASKTLKVGESERANIFAIPDSDYYYTLFKDVECKLSDPEVVSAKLYGLGLSDVYYYVTALKPGITTLTVTVNGKFTASKVYTVPQEVTDVTLSDSSLSIIKGDSVQLTATVEPETASDKTVTWTSSDTKVASVSNTGMVTGLDKGTSTITAKAGGKTATCVVDVTNDTVHVESLVFASDSVFVDSAETISLTYTLTPARATVKAVTFSSDDETTATVSATGEVYGKKVGETIIRISSVDNPDAKDFCVVTVNYVPFHLDLPEPSSDSEYTATIPFKLKGDINHVDSCGIDYSLNPDLTDSVRVYADFASGKSEYSVSLEGLKSHTTYYYRAFVVKNDSDSIVYSDIANVTTQAPDPFKAPAAGVDLGLPSGKLWSPYNMGAQQEADYGRLVSWGDVTGSAVPESQYKNISADFISGDENYDFAAKHWGNKWHMPTMTEWEELFRHTERTLVTVKDTDGIAEVTGWKFTGTNGNSIFLPCSGMSKNGSISESDEKGYYWSGETNSWDSSEIPTYAILDSETYGYGYANGYLGYSIRPVYGDVSAKFAPYGTDDSDKSGETAEAPRSVDLGFGTRWATCNVGASEMKSYAYGDYFSWGDLNPKESYSEDKYKGYSSDRTEYHGYEDYGDDISGSLEYDAATYLWGGNWRLPTANDFALLIKRCTWVWTTMNGVHGYRVYGYDDCTSNSIFLPFTGHYLDSDLFNDDTHGYYWSSSEYTVPDHWETVAYSFYLSISKNIETTAHSYRYIGQSIRPVKTK